MAIRDQWQGWKLKEENITNAAVIVIYINIESTRVIYCYMLYRANVSKESRCTYGKEGENETLTTELQTLF